VFFDEQSLRYFTKKGLLEHITDEDFKDRQKEAEELKEHREELRYHLTIQASYEAVISQKRKEFKKRNAIWRRWAFSDEDRKKLKTELSDLVTASEKEAETVKLKRDVVDILEQVALALQRYVSIPTGYVKLTEEGRRTYFLLDGVSEERPFEDFMKEHEQLNLSRSTS